ncbi:MAG: ATP-binding protein [Chloroflexi bacterium]|nr:ATP-binding protein [Chloroflexota bacterium]MCL5076033.1 ATP-binding protein [Chloroflexota bacterium]
MPTIIEVATLSDEARKGDIFGIVKLYNINNPTKPEASADRILSITYPSHPLSQALKAVAERLSGKRAQGAFIFAGGYGTGKSHCLLTLFHMFSSPNVAKAWQNRWSIKVQLPQVVPVVLQLMEGEEGNPEFLWEPVFKRLGKNSMLGQIRDYPTITQFKEAIGKEPTVIILDELESWYEAIADPVRKTRNLNFLQVLSEVSSDSDCRLVVLASLYGRNEEILGRLGREQVFIQDLGASEDKAEVIRFRLLQSIDQAKAKRVVESYVQRYTDLKRSLGTMVEPIDEYRSRMLNYYPLHPELLEVLFQSFSASRNYQNTRGILYLLSSVLRDRASERDLLLSSDINPENEEVQDDLFKLEPRLVERCLEDIRRTKDENLARGILSTILLRSFVAGQPGANEGQIVLGNLAPGRDINEIHRVLAKLERSAWFLHRSNGRYLIKAEENLPVSINARAERQLAEYPKPAQDKVAEVIESFLKGMEVSIYPLDAEIPDTRQLRVVVSTKFLESDEIRDKVFHGREWRNMVILVRPKTGRDLAQSEELLIRAQRLLVCKAMEQEVSDDKKKVLFEYQQQQEDELRERVQRAYGEWMKASGKGAQVYFRPVACELSTEDIVEKVRGAASTEVVDEAIIAELDEAREQGRRFDELKSMFMKQAGRPLLLDAATLPSRVRSLCASGEIVLELEKRLYDKNNPAREVLDEMRLYLPQYGPSAPTGVVIAPEKEAEKVARGEKLAYQVGVGVEGTAVKEKETVVEVERVPLTSQEHTTPFKMITELEGRLSSDDKVASVTIVLRGAAMEEADNLEQLLADFKSKEGVTQVELSVKLWMPRAMAKDELMKLLGKLPVPTEGTIRATLEVEKHEPE